MLNILLEVFLKEITNKYNKKQCKRIKKVLITKKSTNINYDIIKKLQIDTKIAITFTIVWML
ncbi:hypothetical protein D2A34_17000 [Clostridium chromiireducens]|uniref:Uncharacterized protein n=1 Tax=Clostridium chromiireducens TaxID=225345 RepID=A0A399IKE3_9CLOT|nr:hypothetical protein D2A34_17000 [Clostridium chromiireducens]